MDNISKLEQKRIELRNSFVITYFRKISNNRTFKRLWGLQLMKHIASLLKPDSENILELRFNRSIWINLSWRYKLHISTKLVSVMWVPSASMNWRFGRFLISCEKASSENSVWPTYRTKVSPLQMKRKRNRSQRLNSFIFCQLQRMKSCSS